MIRSVIALSIIHLLFSTVSVSAQLLRDFASEALGRISGNGIGDIRWDGKHLWVGTSSGINKPVGDPFGPEGWVTYTTEDGLARDNIFALADVRPDTIWAATGYGEKVGEDYYPAGAGLSLTREGGVSWSSFSTQYIFRNYYFHPGFERGDGFASVFEVDTSNNLPISIDTVRVYMGKNDATRFTLLIWQDNGTESPGDTIFSKTCEIPGDTTKFTDIDLTSDNIEVNNPSFRIGFTIRTQTSISIARDARGIKEGRNLVYRDTQGRWYFSEELGLGGNWILRAKARTADDSTFWLKNDSFAFGEKIIDIGRPIYDIAIQDTTVWIAAFYGGLARSGDWGQSWDKVTPDDKPFDPTYSNYNHRAFSVVTCGDTIWAGTADGINRSADGGKTWINYNSVDTRIPGNFVVSLGVQRYEGKTILWAGTRPTDKDNGNTGIVKTEDGGNSWRNYMQGYTAWNFGFQDSAVWAATDRGLIRSKDGGRRWEFFDIIDDSSHDRIYIDEVISVKVVEGSQDTTIWVGTYQGLALSKDDGKTWRIIKAFGPIGVDKAPATYAFPNPFSPSRQGAVRIMYNTAGAGQTMVKIYDLALDLVKTLSSQDPIGDRGINWDGKNGKGDRVANGAYLYKVEGADGRVAWGKIVVMD